MNTIEDLHRVLSEHASRAPDGIGLIEAARAGAARARRRHRVATGAGVAAALVAALAAGTVLRPVWAGGPTSRGGAPSATASTPARNPLRLTLSLAPDQRFAPLQVGSSGELEYLAVRATAEVNPEYFADVFVGPPDLLNVAPLRAGERVTVGDHAAYFALVPAEQPSTPANAPGGSSPRLPVQGGSPPGVPTIGWPLPSGAWVVLKGTGGANRQQLMDIAGAVRVGAGTVPVSPFRLGYVPAGLRHESYASRYTGGTDTIDTVTTTAVGLVPAGAPLGRPSLRDLSLGRGTYLLSVVGMMSASVKYHVDDLGQAPVKVAGHDSWYVNQSGGGWVVEPGQATLVVEVGACLYMYDTTDATRFPYEEMKKMVEGTTFGDCTQPGTWFSVP